MRLCGMVLALVLAAAGARAETVEERRAEARRLKNEGAEALERGDVETALQRFRAAHRAYPSPNLLFNIGLALDKVGRGAEALEAYEAFVADPGEAPPEARAHAQERVAFFGPRLGHLAIAASLDDAEVLVDGRVVGVTPHLRTVHVAPGEHAVVAHRWGFEARERVEVAAGATVRISLNLTPIPVDSPPPSATAPPPPKPLYRRWWLWTAVVGVVVVGAAVGLGVGLAPPRVGDFSPTLGEGGPMR